MQEKRRGALLGAAVLTAAAIAATAAFGASVKSLPVKGATYSGVVHDETITVKVSANGKTAAVSLPRAPGFCQGGSGPERQSSKPAAISKQGSLTAMISYISATGADHTPFATVTVKGSFHRFTGAKPVFQGQLEASFEAAKSCDGGESFEAVAG